MHLHFLVISAVLLLAAADEADTQQSVEKRLVGGELIDRVHMSILVDIWSYIERYGFWYREGSGVLYDEFYAIGTAHALYKRRGPNDKRYVVCGRNHRMAEITFLPDTWGSCSHYPFAEADLAVVKLMEPMPLDDKCQTATIGSVDVSDLTMDVLGYQQTENGRVGAVITVDLLTERYCNTYYGPYRPYYDAEIQVCAGNNETGVCRGDAGVLAVVNGTVAVGLASWTYNIRDCYAPDAFTRLSHYQPWIDHIINITSCYT